MLTILEVIIKVLLLKNIEKFAYSFILIDILIEILIQLFDVVSKVLMHASVFLSLSYYSFNLFVSE